MQVSKPTSHVPPPLPASTFSYRDNSYNTEQRKAVQSYHTSSYPATTPSYTPAAPAPPGRALLQAGLPRLAVLPRHQ